VNDRLIVLQHHPAEGVGDLGAWANRNGIEMHVHRADLGELPQALHGPCVLLGGPHAVNAGPGWLQSERAWLRDRLANAAPTLGICLGAQLLADALGGHVHRLARPETGWTRIDFADGSRIDAMEWHEDAFMVPPGARTLASSAACSQQAFESVDKGVRQVGMQFHPEWNAALVASLNAHFGDASPLPRQVDAMKHQRMAAWFHEWLDAWWAS
jgi:GMP synthase-like glutamine amidotransferase